MALNCPIPISQYPHLLLAHGGGGRLMHNLIGQMFLQTFDNPLLQQQHDGAVMQFGETRLAFTTDSYVVRPLFFPGGNIGQLVVHGTVNDLAMCGARPLFLSLGLILEEGLPMETLWTIVQSIQASAEAAHVQVVTGDTKVVDAGKGDGIYINTAGIGILEHNLTIGPSSIQAGDAVLISGDIGRHGVAIMATRLDFETTIESDSAAVADDVLRLIAAGLEIHCLRDLTRGGLASALVELSQSAGLHIHIKERDVPILEEVQGVCEILGFDPLYVANEGRFIVILPAHHVEQALALLPDARLIGQVSDDKKGLVTLQSHIGATRIVDMLSGEQLPRIC
ncbi:MAG: hydrogenase expression/formation protein HypE [Anaerolineales bacterium]|nr:hydrogenase expression/formation protein HypE [Anaerolineales bacterium]